MAIVDNIRIKQDFKPDGYEFEVVEKDEGHRDVDAAIASASESLFACELSDADRRALEAMNESPQVGIYYDGATDQYITREYLHDKLGPGAVRSFQDPMADAVSSLAASVGISPDDIDTSDLNKPVRGYVLPGPPKIEPGAGRVIWSADEDLVVEDGSGRPDANAYVAVGEAMEPSPEPEYTYFTNCDFSFSQTPPEITHINNIPVEKFAISDEKKRKIESAMVERAEELLSAALRGEDIEDDGFVTVWPDINTLT